MIIRYHGSGANVNIYDIIKMNGSSLVDEEVLSHVILLLEMIPESLFLWLSATYCCLS